MSRQAYDDPTAITATLGNMRAFDALVRARGEAGYQRQEPLHEYIVDGRWLLDASGNCLAMSGEDSESPLRLSRGAVLTRKEFWAQQAEGVSLTTRAVTPYVPPGSCCTCCGLSWTWDTVHDFEMEHTYRDVPATLFAGWPTEYALRHVESRTDGRWRRSREHTLRADRYIDLTPLYPDTTTDWQRGQVRNERGTVGLDRLPETLVGDEAMSFTVWTFRHVPCFRFELTQAAYRAVRNACPHGARLTEVPNQYSSHRSAAPWFEVAHPKLPPLTIGRRKRVWTINYPGADRFLDWPHTHGKGYVHVYTEAEMRSVVRQLMAAP